MTSPPRARPPTGPKRLRQGETVGGGDNAHGGLSARRDGRVVDVVHDGLVPPAPPAVRDAAGNPGKRSATDQSPDASPQRRRSRGKKKKNKKNDVDKNGTSEDGVNENGELNAQGGKAMDGRDTEGGADAHDDACVDDLDVEMVESVDEPASPPRVDRRAADNAEPRATGAAGAGSSPGDRGAGLAGAPWRGQRLASIKV